MAACAVALWSSSQASATLDPKLAATARRSGARSGARAGSPDAKPRGSGGRRFPFRVRRGRARVSCACDRRWIPAGFGQGAEQARGARPARKHQGVGTAVRTENDGAVKVLPCWVRHQISCGLLRKRERGDCKQGKMRTGGTAGEPFLRSVGKIKVEGRAKRFLPWT